MNKKITVGFVLRFVGAVAKELMVSAGTPAKQKLCRKAVRRHETVEDDGLFEETQNLLGAGYRTNDYQHLPDQGESPEKQF